MEVEEINEIIEIRGKLRNCINGKILAYSLNAICGLLTEIARNGYIHNEEKEQEDIALEDFIQCISEAIRSSYESAYLENNKKKTKTWIN